MTRETIRGAAETFLWVVASIWIAFVIGWAMGGEYVRREAIRYGSAAEFVDTETGAMRFEWR